MGKGKGREGKEGRNYVQKRNIEDGNRKVQINAIKEGDSIKAEFLGAEGDPDALVVLDVRTSVVVPGGEATALSIDVGARAAVGERETKKSILETTSVLFCAFWYGPLKKRIVDCVFQLLASRVGYVSMKPETVSFVSSCSRMIKPGDLGPSMTDNWMFHTPQSISLTLVPLSNVSFDIR